MKKRKINFFVGNVLPISSQQALNHYHMIIFHQDMDQNVCFLSNDQIWYLRNHPPKMKKNENIVFSSKVPHQCASNKPSNTITWSFFADIWPITSFHPVPSPPISNPDPEKWKNLKLCFFCSLTSFCSFSQKKIYKKSFFSSFFHFFGHILTTFWPENVFFPENEQICLLGLTPLIL